MNKLKKLRGPGFLNRNIRHEELETRVLLAVNLVADINLQAINASNPRELVSVNEQTFFVAESELGTELWKTDGTNAGTSIVADLVEGPGSSSPTNLVAVGGLLFFETGAGESAGVVRSDGTAAGTFPIGPGEILAATDNHVFFGGSPSGNSGFLQSDGTVAGTSLSPGRGIVGTGSDFVVTQIGENLVQLFDNGETSTLRAAPTTDAPLSLLLDDVVMSLASNEADMVDITFNALGSPEEIHSFSVNGQLATFAREHVVRAQDNIYFVTETERVVNENELPLSNFTLWTVNASGETDPVSVGQYEGESGRQLIQELTAGDNGEVWFAGPSMAGFELHKSDGTAEGTVRVTDIANGPANSNPHSLSYSNGLLWFVADSDENQRQIWTTDGTDAGTVALSPASSVEPYLLVVENGVGYFSADSEFGNELWTSDGTIENTRVVGDIHEGISGSFPTALLPTSDGEVLFAATTELGRELWKLSTTETPELVKDIHADGPTRGSNPNNLAALNDRLYFAADDGIHGVELWTSDGTSASRIGDILPGEKGSFPQELTAVGDTLYFVADDGAHGRELWQSDGTIAGTRLAVDVFEGESGSHPASLVSYSGDLYFTAIDRFNAFQTSASAPKLSTRAIWKFDGQTLTKLRELSLEGRVAPEILELTVANDGVYFYETGTIDGDQKATVLRIDASGVIDTIQQVGLRAQRLFSIAEVDGQIAFVTDIEEGNRAEVWTVGDDGLPRAVSRAENFRGTAVPLISTGKEVLYTDRREVWVSDLSDQSPSILPEVGAVIEALRTDSGLFVVTSTPRDGSRLQFTDSLDNELQVLATFSDELLFPAMQPSGLTEFQGEVYFIADRTGDALGAEVWKTNGTVEGTVPVTELDSDLARSRPHSLFALRDQLFFVADDGISGRELWQIDNIAARGDINNDGEINATDIDLLFAADGTQTSNADLNDDSTVDSKDADVLVYSILQTEYGDANLDNRVDFADFLILSGSFGRTSASWAQGDFDGDGTVSFADFLVLSANFGFRL